MVNKGEGDDRYQELKDGIYHGYQPLRARKTTTYSYTPDFIPGGLNIAVARDIDSIPSGPKDAGDYQMVTAHKVNRAPLPDDPYAWSAPKVANGTSAAPPPKQAAAAAAPANEEEEEEE